jgi:hypothetical protein
MVALFVIDVGEGRRDHRDGDSRKSGEIKNLSRDITDLQVKHTSIPAMKPVFRSSCKRQETDLFSCNLACSSLYTGSFFATANVVMDTHLES